MVHAIRIHQTGGPEVLKWESVEVPAPGPGQVRLKQHAVGVNYIDIYQRSGLYKLPLPFIAGSEGAGEVVAVGPGVTDFKVGDRGAYAGADGRLRRGARDAGRPPRQAPRQHRLQDRRRHDAAGHDGALSAARDLQGRQGHHDAAARRRRRHRPHRLPVGAAPGRHHHRHGQLGRQGQARQGGRLHPRHQLQDRGLREAHQGAHRRPGRRCRLRRRRQGHLPRLARLPQAARPVGELRQRLRRRHQLRYPGAVGEGLALRHAADARHLHRQAGGPARQRQRAVRRGRQGHRQDQRQPHLSAEGCRPGARATSRPARPPARSSCCRNLVSYRGLSRGIQLSNGAAAELGAGSR